MNRYFFIVLLSSVFITVYAQDSTYKNLNSYDFQNLINSQEGTLLDVRTYSEYANGHINGAGQLNYYDKDFKQKLLLLNKNQSIYLYCNTGYRSRRAADILIKNGYHNVYNLQNGIMEWNLNELSLVVNSDAIPDNKNVMEIDEFKNNINSGRAIFIDFYAPWCGPCRKMMPMIDSMKNKYIGKVEVIKINVDASKKLVMDLKIKSVPFFVLFNNSKNVFEHNGIISKNELISVLDVIK